MINGNWKMVNGNWKLEVTIYIKIYSVFLSPASCWIVILWYKGYRNIRLNF